MSDWTNLNDVLDLRLRLPIGGKTYIVEPPSAADGAYLMNLMALGLAARFSPLTEAEALAVKERASKQEPLFSYPQWT